LFGGEMMWNPMETAPTDGKDFTALRADGTEVTVHYACDLSGEEQPPFKGFFVKRGNMYVELQDLKGWKRDA
jgi:hypothetical protein